MIVTQKIFLVLGALLAFLAVVTGAFGAHLLRNKLNGDSLAIYEIAVRYQMYHALALLGIAWACGAFFDNLVILSVWILFVGIFIFSGSLYALALTSARFLGTITPFGGVVLLLGWLCFAIGVLKS